MKTLLKTRKNEIGATAIEYGLIAALISVAIITAVSAVGTNLNDVFGAVSSHLGNAVSSAGSSAG
ncbi:MAG: Flp family type IVb pilin [Acetobacter syzygii]|mgnify:CR=1 FL=1|uniref:Flp family type IVb pilin n=1 Tax=Acetobacter syzygii TaxID=146476 RepID=UPI0039EA15F0